MVTNPWPITQFSMTKVTILKGLPASGKSSFAREQVLKSNGKIKRINKDDLRAMIDCGKWSKVNEEQIILLRDILLQNLLDNGFDVIIDDTNFSSDHEKRIREIAGADAVIEVKFFDVPLQECIERDLARGEKSVGKKVILDMYNRYLRPAYVAPIFKENIPDVIICDIDGTLAHMKDRGPFEWLKVGADIADVAIANLLFRLEDWYQIVLLSGRDETCRPETEKWLDENGIQYSLLLMRPEGNTETDWIVKERIYKERIEGKLNVLFVLDDRQQVVDMWRRNGLKCLQVAEGNF